jgi:hypothetical protein
VLALPGHGVTDDVDYPQRLTLLKQRLTLLKRLKGPVLYANRSNAQDNLGPLGSGDVDVVVEKAD